ncbi:glycogen synthase GlgA [Fulvimarina sp. 2208YS6-2-32]|uniref:Glycogen synthase n=1 Tax=Fulvimarina uroteuthidis TaxID=3098149 RepID=A0ABU5HZE1_9HYPH|nr:glycogen synthase GlgA [Fulvimarina sp. 2208YS6-2-32]MDY8108175.1 glycogen synthase GlgA [Fulvimarina sp. 2208YS6-2-32]
MSLQVLSVASEVYPIIKTGGLADVAGALPGALKGQGVTMKTLMPGYRDVEAKLGAGRTVAVFDDLLGVEAEVRAVRSGGLDLFVLHAPALYDREGGPYLTALGYDHPDNWHRFAALSLAGARIAEGAIEGYAPDILHAHDWQAALAPVYLAFPKRKKKTVRTVLTIHNLAFQGNFAPTIFGRLGLADEAWSMDGVEFFNNVGFLKGGIYASDRVTTVSPTYAREILTEEGGMGLGGLLRERGEAVCGIVNGIDTGAWNSADDAMLPATYDAATLDRRAVNRTALLEEMGLAPTQGPIVSIVSRLTWQKGLDVVAEIAEAIVEKGASLIVVGTGDAQIEGAFQKLSVAHRDRIGVRIAYDEALSHRVQAGADAILIPSRFEPCGLTQLYGLRYGCIPLVARVGGLADTVIDANYAARQAGCANGIIFDDASPQSILTAIDRLIEIYQTPGPWRAMQTAAMGSDVSWTASAELYANLYRDLMKDDAR